MEGVASHLQTYYFTIYNTGFKIELVSLSAKAVSDISYDFLEFTLNEMSRDVHSSQYISRNLRQGEAAAAV